MVMTMMVFLLVLKGVACRHRSNNVSSRQPQRQPANADNANDSIETTDMRTPREERCCQASNALVEALIFAGSRGFRSHVRLMLCCVHVPELVRREASVLHTTEKSNESNESISKINANREAFKIAQTRKEKNNNTSPAHQSDNDDTSSSLAGVTINQIKSNSIQANITASSPIDRISFTLTIKAMISSRIVQRAVSRTAATTYRRQSFPALASQTSTSTSTCRFLSTAHKEDEGGSNNYSPNNPFVDHSRNENIIPGAGTQSPYGSLGEPLRPTQSVSWQAQHNSDVQRVTQNATIYELTQQQSRTIEAVVPWFFSNMPSSYFQQVPEQFRMDHIKAISAIKDANMDMYLNLKSHTQDGRTIYTFIRPGTDPGTLLSMVEELPFHPEQNLTRLHVFSSLDGSMSLNMFVYGESPTKPRLYLEDENIQKILSFADQVQQGQVHDIAPHPLFEKESLVKYLALCKDNYLKIVSQHPERFLRQRLLFDSVSGTEGVEVSVEPAIHERIHNQERDDYFWVDVAMANSLPQVALEHTCRLLYVQGFDVGRARLDVIPDGDNGSVTLLRLLVHPLEQDLQDDATVAQKFELLQSELKRAKWLDDTTQKLVFERYPELGVARGEIITAFAGLMHPILAKQNAIVYSKHNILVRETLNITMYDL